MESTGFNVSPAGPEAFRDIMEAFDGQMGVILTGDAFQSVRSTRYGPGIFPGIVVVLLALVLMILAVQGGLRRSVEASRLDRDGMIRMGMAVAFVLGYLILADQVGYVLTATGLLLAMLRCLQVKWPVALAVALVFAPMTYQVFAVALRVPLPWGWLGW
jgi:putative tricarboxylic transport membrane protein